MFAATEHLVPVTHPQPYRGFLVLATGRVPAEVAGEPVEGSWRPARSRWWPTAPRRGGPGWSTSLTLPLG